MHIPHIILTTGNYTADGFYLVIKEVYDESLGETNEYSYTHKGYMLHKH